MKGVVDIGGWRVTMVLKTYHWRMKSNKLQLKLRMGENIFFGKRIPHENEKIVRGKDEGGVPIEVMMKCKGITKNYNRFVMKKGRKFFSSQSFCAEMKRIWRKDERKRVIQGK